MLPIPGPDEDELDVVAAETGRAGMACDDDDGWYGCWVYGTCCWAPPNADGAGELDPDTDEDEDESIPVARAIANEVGESDPDA